MALSQGRIVWECIGRIPSTNEHFSALILSPADPGVVDPQGTVTLLGCAPLDDEVVGESVAVAPDAVYFSTQNQRTFTWEIDRIAR